MYDAEALHKLHGTKSILEMGCTTWGDLFSQQLMVYFDYFSEARNASKLFPVNLSKYSLAWAETIIYQKREAHIWQRSGLQF